MKQTEPNFTRTHAHTHTNLNPLASQAYERVGFSVFHLMLVLDFHGQVLSLEWNLFA